MHWNALISNKKQENLIKVFICWKLIHLFLESDHLRCILQAQCAHLGFSGSLKKFIIWKRSFCIQYSEKLLIELATGFYLRKKSGFPKIFNCPKPPTGGIKRLKTLLVENGLYSCIIVKAPLKIWLNTENRVNGNIKHKI